MEEKIQKLDRYSDIIGDDAVEKLAKALTLKQVRQLVSIVESECEAAVLSELEYVSKCETMRGKLSRLFDRIKIFRERITRRGNNNNLEASEGNASGPDKLPGVASTATGERL